MIVMILAACNMEQHGKAVSWPYYGMWRSTREPDLLWV